MKFSVTLSAPSYSDVPLPRLKSLMRLTFSIASGSVPWALYMTFHAGPLMCRHNDSWFRITDAGS